MAGEKRAGSPDEVGPRSAEATPRPRLLLVEDEREFARLLIADARDGYAIVHVSTAPNHANWVLGCIFSRSLSQPEIEALVIQGRQSA